MKILYYLALLAVLVFSSCKSDPTVAPENTSSSYTLVQTASSLNTKVEVYSSSANRLLTGYNSIGFKIYINEQAQTNGFVKFSPKMYHFSSGGPMHHAPASPNYYYDGQNGMFIGYVCFMMPSDTNAFWYGFVNYNNAASVDSFTMSVQVSSTAQMRLFDDEVHGHSYYLTLVKPTNPQQSPNVFQCLLHQTNDDINYAQIDSAEMFIRPWMEAMGHGSSNNRDPVYIGGGIYEGQVNFNMSGIWYVYDSIKVNNEFVTPTPPPKFVFDVP